MRTRILRRLGSLVLCAALVWGLATPASAKFKDVPSGHWASSAIAECVRLGFLKGETAERFGVGHQMTRAAFTVALSRFFGWTAGAAGRTIYTDVPSDAWYASAVQAAYENGALTRQSSAFRPADPITREELAVMLVRALGYGPIAGVSQDLPLPFRDVRTNRGYVALAYTLGLVSGVTADTFAPERTATREQAAVMLTRLYAKLHPAAIGMAAVVSAKTDASRLTGLQAAAISAGKLSGGTAAHYSEAMTATEAAALRDAAKAGGAAALLRVSGSGSLPPAEAAALLAEKAESGGWDGLYLDLEADTETLTALALALRPALGSKLLYVAAPLPSRQNPENNIAPLTAAVDRLVARVPAAESTSGSLPVSPLEPSESVCYGLALARRDGADLRKVSLLLTTHGSKWTGSKQSGAADGGEIRSLLDSAQTTAYYSERYDCAYLHNGSTVIWYLDEAALAARVRLLGFFGVGQICLDGLDGILTAAS